MISVSRVSYTLTLYFTNHTTSTDVLECMACSDNVVRAGLTQKHKDKDTLCEMLTYNMQSAEQTKFTPRKHPTVPNAFIYDPPTPEFTVVKVDIPAGTKELCIPSVAGGMSCTCSCVHVCVIVCNYPQPRFL